MGRGPRGQERETAVGSNERRETQSRELMAFPPTGSREANPLPAFWAAQRASQSCPPRAEAFVHWLRLPQVKGSPRSVSFRLLGGPAHTSGGGFQKGRQKLHKVLASVQSCWLPLPVRNGLRGGERGRGTVVERMGPSVTSEAPHHLPGCGV